MPRERQSLWARTATCGKFLEEKEKGREKNSQKYGQMKIESSPSAKRERKE
jgi:hypothetical protein